MILEHPWIYLSNSLRAALPLLFAPLRSSIDLQLGLLERGSSLLYWGQTPGRGLIPLLLQNTSGPTLGLVLVVVIYFLVVSAGPGAYARFRVPLMPSRRLGRLGRRHLAVPGTQGETGKTMTSALASFSDRAIMFSN